MKAIKKMLCILLAITLACGVGVMTDCQKAEAAYKVYAPNDVRCGVGKRYYKTARIDLVSGEDTIKNIKVYQGKKKSKNLVAKLTALSHSDYSPYAYITYYAKKPGTYKIKFDVYKSKKSKRTSRVITVHAQGYDSSIVAVSFNGKNIVKDYKDCYSCYTDRKSGKIKFTLAKGYSIKKIRMSYRDQNGDWKTIAFKNGKKATFGRYGYSSDTESYWSKDMWALTQFEITYKDRYAQNVDNSEHTVSYYVYTKASKWY